VTIQGVERRGSKFISGTEYIQIAHIYKVIYDSSPLPATPQAALLETHREGYAFLAGPRISSLFL
jgi:hypothetical protein